MKKPKILVIGSLNMDQIAVTKRCPNAGETVIGGSFSKASGGKGSKSSGAGGAAWSGCYAYGPCGARCKRG